MAISTKARLRQKKQTKKIVWLVGSVVTVLVLLVVGIYIILFSSLFEVRGFDIVANEDGRVLTNIEKETNCVSTAKERNIIKIKIFSDYQKAA